MSLGDSFPDGLKHNFAERNIDLGKAILIHIPDFNQSYDKYVVIASFTDSQIAYVVINTDVNQNVFPTPYLRSLNLLVKKMEHPFLSHDSYVDCSKIREFDKAEVIEFLKNNPERAVGNVTPSLLRDIQNTISTARTIPIALKKKYGF